MSNQKMHAEEIEITEFLISMLLDDQFPEWAQLSLKPVSGGTQNAIYKLGIDMAIRLPRIKEAADMMVRWTVLSTETRNKFREIVKVDDAAWARGRGWALTFGLVAFPYYEYTNLILARIAR